jgi:uncharacterized membrane protein
MAKDLRETMLQSAASTYGSKHYRGILAMHSLRKAWPVLVGILLLAAAAGAGYLMLPVVESTKGHGDAIGAVLVAGLFLIALGAWGVRRARSPYRRRRFR